nr:zf-CCHC domain-containing protein/UBN2 domain-containing protein [Tanacetum cinerariifolium]
SIDSGFARFNTIITSLKALDECFSSKNYVRKFLKALHPKWRAKVTVIKESKDLSSLALDELIRNLKVHEVVMEKDFEIYKCKKKQIKSIALKAKKESSDDKTLTSRSDDEEYAIARGKSDRKCFRYGDLSHLIGDCPKTPRNKDQKAFIGGSWSDSENDAKDKTNDEACLMAQSSNERIPQLLTRRVSSPFKDLSNIGSPGVDRLSMMPQDPYAYVKANLQAPPSPDYVPGPEHPPSPAYVPGFVLEPVYLKEDYEDPEEDLTDYPTDEEDDDDEEESFKDNAGDEEEDEDEDKEHPALAYIVPPPVHCVTARMFVRAQIPISLPSWTKVAKLLAIPNPPPLPLSPLLSPLRYRAAMIRMRAEAPSTSHLLPSKKVVYYSSMRFKVNESSSAPTARPTGGFRTNYRFVGTLNDEIRRDPKRELGYGNTVTWDKMVEDMQGTPIATNMAGLSQRMTDFVTTIRQGTDEIYVILDDAHDDRSFMSGQLNMLRRDRRAHARTTRLMESEAILSREAWVQSMDTSNTARAEVMSLCTTVLAHQTKIAGLRAADRIRHTQLVEALTLLNTLQTQMVALQRQQGHIKGPTHPEGVADALAARDADRSRSGEDSHDSGTSGHFKRECPKLKNNNYSNQGGNGNALARVYAVGHAGTNLDSNTVTGTFLLKNRYVSILFDTGVDRSFVSTAFSSQNDITPTTLDQYYDVELADGRIISTGTLSIGLVQNERIVRPTEGAIQQRLYKAQFLTLGSSGLVCQEEGWIISNVHRLSRTEQAGSDESLSTPKD